MRIISQWLVGGDGAIPAEGITTNKEDEYDIEEVPHEKYLIKVV